MPELSLRIVLIGIGVLIIGAVYLLTTARRRRDARNSFDRQFSRLNIPDVILQHDDEDEPGPRTRAAPPDLDATIEERIDAASESAAGAPAPVTESEPAAAPAAARRAAQPRVLPLSGDAPEELPRVVNELAADEPDNRRRDTDQLDLFGAGHAPREGSERAPGNAQSGAPAARAGAPREDAPAARDDGVISLYIRAHEGRQFGGPELVRAFNAAGMRHGEMSIFHHFGAGDLSSEAALFSAANMFEPGTFDLEKIEAMRTTGIVLFMQLPTELDDAVAFELMLNSAQRMAELSGGVLYATPREPLDAESIAALRRRISRFGASNG